MKESRTAPTKVAATARDIVDSEGLRALTATRLARELGLHQSSIYTLYENTNAIVHMVRQLVLRELLKELKTASTRRVPLTETFNAIASAYLRYVRQHYGSYSLIMTPSSYEAERPATDFERLATFMREMVLNFVDKEPPDFAFNVVSYLHGACIASAAGFPDGFELEKRKIEAGLRRFTQEIETR